MRNLPYGNTVEGGIDVGGARQDSADSLVARDGAVLRRV
jgi:hypothetical protein